MVAGENFSVLQIRGRDIPQIKRFAVGNIHSEHLIEITIVKKILALGIALFILVTVLITVIPYFILN